MLRLLPLAFVFCVACGQRSGSPNEPTGDPPAPTHPACRGCAMMECYRPYTCVRACGDEPVMCGCCECAAGWLDVMMACPEQDPAPGVPAPTEDRATEAAGEAAEAIDPAIACTVDDDCRVVLSPCDCACYARRRDAPPIECEPARNCGVASPCAGEVVHCEAGRCLIAPT